jgi:hypothetical protein
MCPRLKLLLRAPRSLPFHSLLVLWPLACLNETRYSIRRFVATPLWPMTDEKLQTDKMGSLSVSENFRYFKQQRTKNIIVLNLWRLFWRAKGVE